MFVSKKASLDEPVYLGRDVSIYGNVSIGKNTVIEEGCVIGKPDMYGVARMDPSVMKSADDFDEYSSRSTKLGEGVRLGSRTLIYEGSVLADAVETEDMVRIGWDSKIGEATRCMYSAQVYCYVMVGSECRIAGFVGDNTVIGDKVSMFGTISHDYPAWNNQYEYRPHAMLEDEVVVGFGAQVVGGVTVGKGSYVASNAVVTRSVPADRIVFGINRVVRKRGWRGKMREVWLKL